MVVGNLIHDVDGNAAFNPGKKSYYRCATVATLAVTVVVTKAKGRATCYRLNICQTFEKYNLVTF